jgi:hypothetical protein
MGILEFGLIGAGWFAVFVARRYSLPQKWTARCCQWQHLSSDSSRCSLGFGVRESGLHFHSQSADSIVGAVIIYVALGCCLHRSMEMARLSFARTKNHHAQLQRLGSQEEPEQRRQQFRGVSGERFEYEYSAQ